MCEENKNRYDPLPSLQKGGCDGSSGVLCRSGNKIAFGNPQKELNSFHHLSLSWQNALFLPNQNFSA